MGDVAMTVPVIRVFTQTYPEVQLTILSRAFFKPFFENIPNVNFIDAEVKGKHKGFLGLLKLAREAKNLKIDAVADLHNVIRSKVITKYLNLSGITSTTIDKGRASKKALTREKNKDFKQITTTHQRYADVFEKLGFPLDLSNFNAPHPSKLNTKLQNFVVSSTKKTIGIAPFAAYKSKMYPLNLMKEVVKILDASQKFNIVLFGGGKTEIEQLTIFENEFNSVKNSAGKLSFKEELALISNLDAMLSMDSGNGHLAAMFGVPVITLWGVTHPFAGFVPFNQTIENQLIPDLEKYPLIPTSVYGNSYPEGYENAMKTISPQLVVEKINEALFIKS